MKSEDEKFGMTATTMAGLENLLEQELIALGAESTTILSRAVSYTGNTELMYKANYRCRTALRILKPITEFIINTEEDLYTHIYKIAWEEYLTPEKTFAVDAVVFSSLFTHSQFVALRVKDAIADRFRMLYKIRPSVNPDKPDLRINIHLTRNLCIVSLDSSGISLHKRGYRIAPVDAPISEVLAAGMIMLSGWDKKSAFVDPMCGSGTLLIEAAMIANNIPAGYYRQFFGFQQWNNFDMLLWEKIKTQSSEEVEESDAEITGCDISARSIEAATKNIFEAKFHKDIRIKQSSFEDFIPPVSPGVLMTNPPYGERLKTDDIISLYKSIGDGLKHHYSGYHAWIISSHFDALKFIGLRPSRKISLFNGPLECKFVNFQLYEGSKKTSKSDI